MAELNVVKGDATDPKGDGNKIIVHVCNDAGAWGAGFVMAISRRWKAPEDMYHKWRTGKVKAQTPFQLGEVQFVSVGGSLWVANMIAQTLDIRDTSPPIKYAELKKCLMQVATEAKRLKASVHMPRIGCGLAGGTWEEVGPIVQETLIDQGVEATVYDFGN